MITLRLKQKHLPRVIRLMSRGKIQRGLGWDLGSSVGCRGLMNLPGTASEWRGSYQGRWIPCPRHRRRKGCWENLRRLSFQTSGLPKGFLAERTADLSRVKSHVVTADSQPGAVVAIVQKGKLKSKAIVAFLKPQDRCPMFSQHPTVPRTTQK